jgi:alkylation response protein AidB-like acyl-CoA dehydrogenase
MNFESTEEQEALVGAVARFLAEQLPTNRLRGPSEDASETNWGALANLGLFSIGASTTSGGMGLDLCDEALVCRELGRYLVTPCALATVIGRRVAALSGRDELATSIMSGACQIAFGFDSQPELESQTRSLALLDACGAQQILIVTRDRMSLIPRSALRTHRRAEPLDESITIEIATYDLDVVTCDGADGIGLLELSILASAMLVGIAEAALDAAVEYAKQRHQFGAPIGSFQAIKHLCADNAVRVDAAWSQTLWAALALQENAGDAPSHAAAAVLLADEAGRNASQDNVQIHGGMGFTAECNAHRYVKRRHVLSRVATHCIDAQALLLSSAQVQS